MKRFSAKPVALGGMLGAVAGVIMGLGGLIPIATYVCPMLCCLIGHLVFQLCGKRIAWAWYALVAILSALMAPDREGALVYLALGYYPMVKPWMDARRLPLLWKALLFNASVGLVYGAMIYLLGMEYLVQESVSLGVAGLLVMAALGNVTFLLLDKVLEKFLRFKKGRS